MQIYRGTRLQRGGAALLLSFGIVGLAAAAESGDAVASTSQATETAGVIAVPSRAVAEVAGIGRPIDADALGELRGGDDNTVDNDIRVDGHVSDNSAENIFSGANLIDGGAFGNAAGVSTVIQNSGSNVLIQNAMIVNVQFGVPGP